MLGEVDQGAVVNDAASRLADDRGLHAVVEDLAGSTANCRKSRHVATQNRLHVLVQHEAGPDQPAKSEHEREQPNNPCLARLVSECDLELSKVDLGLVAGRRFEANLKAWQWRRAQIAQDVGHCSVAAGAPRAQLPPQPTSGQARIGRHPLT